MQVTALEIAKACGVSQPTVSRILRNKAQRYSAQTRQKVLDTANAMGYRINAAARSTRTGRFGTISLLLGTKAGHSSLPNGLLNGIQDALAQQDLNLMVVRMPDEQLTNQDYVPRMLRELSTDGLLIDYTHGIPPAMQDLIARHRLPAVWINSQQAHNCVRPDDLNASMRATEYLLGLGHRQIAYADFSHGPDFPDPHFSMMERRKGYVLAMRQAGLTPRLIMAQSGFDVASPERLAFADALLRQPDRPTAIITYSQTTALPFLLAGAFQGLRVPHDLSLIDYREDAMVYLGPRFTALYSPTAEVGRLAVEMLRTKISNRQSDIPCVLAPYTFDEGETCRAV